MRPQRTSILLLALVLLPLASGCGTLIGNVKPIVHKSNDYTVTNLATEDPSRWQQLPSAKSANDSTDVSDLSFQSRRSASIVSLNSACRPRIEEERKSLKELTHELLLGITDVSERSQKKLKVAGVPALETTITGSLAGQSGPEAVKIRTVVLRNEDCVYDLMFVSRPDRFDLEEPVFSKFVESLRLS